MKKSLLACAALVYAVTSGAQKIDFNNTSTWAEDRLTETGYTAWAVGQGTSATATVDGITITVSVDGGAADRVLKGNWWKQGVQSYSKLVSDGIGVYALDADGNTPQIQQGSVCLKLTISGLAPGEHSLLAYHNNTDGYNAPPLNVLVGDRRAAEGVVQTNRAQTASESGQSYITFTAEAGTDVTITYSTTPQAGVDYTQGQMTTSLFLNAIVFDQPNPLTTASDPIPANGDTHAATTATPDEEANGTTGSVQLQWTAASSAKHHHIYIGTSPETMTEVAVTDSPSHTMANADPFETYYWRVDEEDSNGHIYKGEVWTFRPRRIAFPGAEGYGRFAIGGRGGAVYHVTSLDDNPSDPQPGTLRYGITRISGPRTIVFDVAGTITLKERLTIADKYVTVAGQTAPGRGIMLRGKAFGMQSDGITRFIRMRLGGADDWDGHSPNPNTSDGLGMAGNDHSIMDHCSVSWTIDEAFSSRNAKNVTLQRTLISEALNQAGHKNYDSYTNHGYAATIGGDYGSYHHNLLAHCEGRNWSMSGGLDGDGAYAGHHDMVNNVCFNWGGRACDGGTHEGQFVGNYYKMGPATTQKTLLKAELEGTGKGSQSYYVSGNIRENTDGSKTTDKLNDTYRYTTSGGQVVDWEVFRTEPFFESHIKIEPAEQALRSVLSDVGCNLPAIDNHDERMVSETLNGTTSTVGSRTGKKGLIDKESDAEGFAGLNIVEASRPEGFDTDGDGMPDWFEDATGTDKASADNNGRSTGQPSFTNLEYYINWMALPHFILKTGTTNDIDLRPYFAGFPDGTFSTDVTDGTASVTADGTLSVSSDSQQLASVDVTVNDSKSGTKMTRTFNFCFTDNIPDTEVSTTINEVSTDNGKLPRAYYTLSGVKVDKPGRGVYISNGRKYVSK